MAILTHDETVSITKIFGVYLCDAMGVTSNKKLKGKKLNSVLIKFVLCPHWLWWKVQNVFKFKAGCILFAKLMSLRIQLKLYINYWIILISLQFLQSSKRLLNRRIAYAHLQISLCIAEIWPCVLIIMYKHWCMYKECKINVTLFWEEFIWFKRNVKSVQTLRYIVKIVPFCLLIHWVHFMVHIS